MNAIELLTREKLNLQDWLDRYRSPEDRRYVLSEYREAKQELVNIERALETLEAEAQRKAGV